MRETICFILIKMLGNISKAIQKRKKLGFWSRNSRMDFFNESNFLNC